MLWYILGFIEFNLLTAVPIFQDIPYTFAAIGDWGVSLDHSSTTTHPRHDKPGTIDYNRDYNSQKFIGIIMGKWAESNKPHFIINHGDNFYWDGLYSHNDNQLIETFEKKYSNPSLNVPWYGVMGNHDYGGGAPLWHDNGTKAMQKKLDYQTKYKSPNNDRWQLRDSYYKVTEKGTNFSIDIFNIDTNAARIHGYDEICCQCYANDNPCDQATGCLSTNKECKSGCATVDAVNSCRKYLNDLWNTNMRNLENDLATSTATWKIINSHYGPRLHMSVPQQNQLLSIMKKYHTHLFMYGHTHGEGHEYKTEIGTHFILNGGGGGYQVAGTHFHEWDSTIYAFVGVKVDEEKLRVEFHSFDDKWGNFDGSIIGGSKVVHCWDVPHDGTIGQAC